jgi:hypothetical protein
VEVRIVVSTELHEAAHAAMAVLMDRRVEFVEVDPGHHRPGETLGHARIPVGEEVEASQLAIAIAGYLSDGKPGWPPPYEEAREERLEALGTTLRLLDVDEPTYDAAVGRTQAILATPDFRRLQDAIARALAAVPRLAAEDVEALAEARMDS